MARVEGSEGLRLVELGLWLSPWLSRLSWNDVAVITRRRPEVGWAPRVRAASAIESDMRITQDVSYGSLDGREEDDGSSLTRR